MLDYRASAGLDLLPDLILDGSGMPDTKAIRGIVEMRSAIAPDVARLAALRGAEAVAPQLDEAVAAMKDAGDDLPALQEASQEFWTHLVIGADNIAYRLAWNTMREIYDRAWDLLRPLLAEELRDLASYRAVAAAVRRGDEGIAERRARKLVRLGEAGIAKALARIDSRTKGGLR